MTTRELEKRLSRAIGHAAPDNLEDVLSRSEARKGNVMPMTQKSKKTLRIAALGGVLAACLALMLMGGGFYYHQTGAVASVISLDVNPSIELTINKNEKVLSCTPMNADAALVLSEMGGGADLKGTNVDVAVNALVGALVRHGYLTGDSSAILLTVEDNNEKRAANLQAELSGIAHSALLTQASNAGVISQTITMDTGREQKAHQNNISTGKAALINQVIAQNGSLQFEALSALTVNELQNLIQAGAPGMPIGKIAAGIAAKTYAGAASLAANAITVEIDSELDKAPAHYAVELRTVFGEFDYMVDAYTGEILRGVANILDFGQDFAQGNGQMPAQPETSAQPATPIQPTAPAQPATPIQPTAPAQPETPIQPTTPAQPTTPIQPTAPPTAPSYIGLDAAKRAALAHAGFQDSDTHYCNRWLEYEDGLPKCYKVEFAVGSIEYEYEIDLYNGTVLEYETEQRNSYPHDSSGGNNAPGGGTDIGQAAVKQIAFSHAALSEAQVSNLKIERDYDDGVIEYKVKFKYNGLKYKYEIDAATGKILKYECEHD